jgi:hypothetical protein
MTVSRGLVNQPVPNGHEKGHIQDVSREEANGLAHLPEKRWMYGEHEPFCPSCRRCLNWLLIRNALGQLRESSAVRVYATLDKGELAAHS